MTIIHPIQEVKWTTDLFTYDDFVCARNYKSELGVTRKRLTMNTFHTSIVVNIYEDGVFCVEHNKLIIMSLLIGCLSLCKNHNINVGAADKQLDKMRKSRGESKIKDELSGIIKHLENTTDIRNCDDVANILDYYSNSKIVRDCYYSIYDKQPKNFKKKNNIPATLISKCKDLLSKELDTSVFNIRRNKDNDAVDIYIPNDFLILIGNLRADLFHGKSTGEVIRMCFIQGLYLLSDIIVSKKIDFGDKLANSAVWSLTNLYIKIRK